jgi:hypothetical protein
LKRKSSPDTEEGITQDDDDAVLEPVVDLSDNELPMAWDSDSS